MLERLFAGLVNGPSLNCRPYASRQRIDLTAVSKLRDIEPFAAIHSLLGERRRARFTPRVPAPSTNATTELSSAPMNRPEPRRDLSPEQAAWNDQQTLLRKFHTLADDARTYEQDTGVHVLELGFPLLSLPPAMGSNRSAGTSRRILAPIAMIPVSLTVKTGVSPSVDLSCRGGGMDFVTPNLALLAWLERQTGVTQPEMFADERGEEPWREIQELVEHVSALLKIDPGDLIARAQAGELTLMSAPKAEDAGDRPSILPAAVLGLFPVANQGLLRDTQAMIASESPLVGPVESFLDVRAALIKDEPAQEAPTPTVEKRTRTFSEERLISHADPCQTRAVRLASTSRGLVVHGPPGTGKSQTITNVIGDHLARGERVLFVCDKRTALDVVLNRLEHMGLGDLCALVHDPQRDQRDLYKAVRDKLDALVDTTTNASAETLLKEIDVELQRLHSDFASHRAALMERDADGNSFHELMGEWLGLHPTVGSRVDARVLKSIPLSFWREHQRLLEEVVTRAEQSGYGSNPWTRSAGGSVAALLSHSVSEIRQRMESALEAADAADATIHESIPPFAVDQSLDAQSQIRSTIAQLLRKVSAFPDASLRERWAGKSAESVAKARRLISEAQPHLEALRAGTLDSELLSAAKSGSLGNVVTDLGDIEAYLAIAKRWYAWFCFSERKRAGLVLRRFGLAPTPDSAERLKRFLAGWRTRVAVSDLVHRLRGTQAQSTPEDDEFIESTIATVSATLDVREAADSSSALAPRVSDALADSTRLALLIDGLERSSNRASALSLLETRFKDFGHFDENWLTHALASAMAGRHVHTAVATLAKRLDTLESVLRVREALAGLPVPVQTSVQSLIQHQLPAKAAMLTLQKAMIEAELLRRLESASSLHEMDATRLANSLNRYRQLDDAKKPLVREAVIHRWTSKQKQRLLVSTLTRLNSVGADLKRRLTLRGERAMRLRQVIAAGREAEGGDPLFDLCPVWMASPETVAQLFPREAIFDVVIFDEASQCRLEEALPVLIRAHRVVVAGDPKQLPPTRFFESTVTASEDDDPQTDQELFESRQGEIQDLLEASLGLEIQECYLDVHYRSRNADLIEFSNQQFYGSRLQPIPGHPSNRARYAPITLYRVKGLYEDRCNPVEAKEVGRIVRDLLRRAEPPSIGIACFNLQQRDLILDALEELAEADPDFAGRLADARQRRGDGSFEGLFVKNLENVQGDERDHIIISTTYGPNREGKFYRRFGPVGLSGGGRRLNVLVTRARHEVHLVTSIPREEYQSLPPIPAGQTPGGAWLLFAYLQSAERLAEAYETNHRILETAKASSEARVTVRPIMPPSTFAKSLGKRLAREHNIGSEVHWGNSGFCVDVALAHPTRVDDVTIGVLCDACRFDKTEDPMAWDVFRTTVLEAQGWTLHRVWTPHFFRDADSHVDAITKHAEALAEKSLPDHDN